MIATLDYILLVIFRIFKWALFEKPNRPAAERRIGLVAQKFYLVGLVLGVPWLIWVTVPSVIAAMADLPAIETQRFLLCGAGAGFTLLYFVCGGRLSAFNPPRFMPPHLWVIGMVCFVAYGASFYFLPSAKPLETLWRSFVAFDVPLFVLISPMLRLSVWEYIKETNAYRELFVLFGRGGPTGRWSGMKSNIDHDVTRFIQDSDKEIVIGTNSVFYYGKTIWWDDTRIGGRHIGTNSEQHVVLLGLSGAGKSSTCLMGNILRWNGGVIAVDFKRELSRVCAERRSKYAPVHIVDAYGDETAHWNPLRDINRDSPTARAELSRLCQALIIQAKHTSDTGDHFNDTTKITIRGVAGYATTLPKEQCSLPSVFDLIKFGRVGGKTVDQEAIRKLVVDMGQCTACGGVAMEAASLLKSMSPNELSGLFSTLSRSIDFLNEHSIRRVMTGKSSFNFADCKTKNESVFLVIPEKHIEDSTRFMRLFYTNAIDVLDNQSTLNPKGSKRRVLMVFDELNALKNFPPAATVANYKRSSFIKGVFVVQNFQQFTAHYSNIDDFIVNSDILAFGLHTADAKGREFVEKALGRYSDEWREGSTMREAERDLLAGAEITEFLDPKNPRQLVIPASGRPMRLARVAYYDQLSSSEYGDYRDVYVEPAPLPKAEPPRDEPQPPSRDPLDYDADVDWRLVQEQMDRSGSLTQEAQMRIFENIQRQDEERGAA